MVGIVLVSHSEKLAAGVQELAQQMVQGAVQCAIAAGIDDPENPFGTDAMKIYHAIASVYSDEGVVVLMDLGSAILSAEMALEFLSDEQRDKVRLCEAPLVEGAIAAFVQAATGANIEQVLGEARGALAAKATQLSGGETPLSVPLHLALEQPTTNNQQLTTNIQLTVQNQMGLHARPAAKFVATASRFASHITLQNLTANSQFVNAKSINQVIMLGVRPGHEIAIAATGTDATDAVAALQHLVDTNFGEAESHPLPASALPDISIGANAQLSGIPTSPGIAIGTVVKYQPTVLKVKDRHADNPEVEWQQLQIALVIAREQIESLRQKAFACGEEEAAIFDAHLLYLDDPTLVERSRQRIFDERESAAAAWQAAIDETVASYHSLADPYLQERAADVADVGRRVLSLLTGMEVAPLDLKEPAILVATDLTPSETAQLDSSKVLGICTVGGGATSHTGILARSLGIPAVVGVGIQVLQLEHGTQIALDGETGQVWVKPDDTQLSQLQVKRDRQLAVKRKRKAAAAKKIAITKDGHRVRVMANIGGVTDAQLALESGAEGVGLLRSEFLYLNRVSPPTEEEQWEVYREIAAIFSPHPLIIRTLDIGGDKPLSYLNSSLEANPFLGWRGIRISLDYPDLLKTQLRAILRASSGQQVKLMFPMIASMREVQAAKEILSVAQAELRQAGIPFNEAMEVGIMIEVPAAVAIADRLAEVVDFFSIGTNDLSQYVMAADRTHPKVAALADAFEPAVLRMIQQTVTAAHQAGIQVGVCGELASSPLATPILLGLGVKELSMNPPAIGAVKAAISRLTLDDAEAIAHAMLQMDSAEAVKHYVSAW
ncbi:MAG TPA: phosphoenolpyruvate--protein phosphotransferase [Allocoleopsis sp.]